VQAFLKFSEEWTPDEFQAPTESQSKSRTELPVHPDTTNLKLVARCREQVIRSIAVASSPAA
jgi:hypothetical protein